MSDLVAQTLADPTVTAVGTALGVALIALWLAAAWWAYADATRRTEHSLAGFIAAGWILLSTPLMLPLALAIYAFARPQATAGDRRVTTLIAELEATATDQRCRACSAEIDVAWLRCPACATWLASPCTACGRWSDDSLEACPWCGDESRERPYVDDLVPATVPIAIAVETIPAAARDGLAAAAAAATPERRSGVFWRAGGPGSRSPRGETARPTLAPEGRRPFGRGRPVRA